MNIRIGIYLTAGSTDGKSLRYLGIEQSNHTHEILQIVVDMIRSNVYLHPFNTGAFLRARPHLASTSRIIIIYLGTHYLPRIVYTTEDVETVSFEKCRRGGLDPVSLQSGPDPKT